METIPRAACVIILAQSMCIAILVAAGIWQHYHPPADHFFYADGVHTPYPIELLEDLVENEPKLLADVGQWVVETFSIDFLNYQRDLSRASRHYTVQGWNSFAAEFIESGNFAEIKRAKLSSTAVPERAPIILQKTLVGNRYTYRITSSAAGDVHEHPAAERATPDGDRARGADASLAARRRLRDRPIERPAA